MIEPSDDEGEMEDEEETKEMEGMISVKSEEGSRVKKFIVSYETKLLKTPSPTPSHGKCQHYFTLIHRLLTPCRP